jgi:hypothetical protein
VGRLPFLASSPFPRNRAVFSSKPPQHCQNGLGKTYREVVSKLGNANLT